MRRLSEENLHFLISNWIEFFVSGFPHGTNGRILFGPVSRTGITLVGRWLFRSWYLFIFDENDAILTF
jgi:hypothetical protein